jgi:hypothetical protein
MLDTKREFHLHLGMSEPEKAEFNRSFHEHLAYWLDVEPTRLEASAAILEFPDGRIQTTFTVRFDGSPDLPAWMNEAVTDFLKRAGIDVRVRNVAKC